MLRAGRRLAYSPRAWRSVTLTLRNPSPTGVVIGPFSATLLRLIDSRTWSGKGVPCSAMTASPASTTSHSKPIPVASRTRRDASASSGPMPSPGIRVTRWAMARLYLRRPTGRGRPPASGRPDASGAVSRGEAQVARRCKASVVRYGNDNQERVLDGILGLFDVPQHEPGGG